jgi:hypothetical protein
VGERDALAPLLDGELPEAIESDARLDLVTSGDLAAITSEVPLADYGEEELQAHLTDAAWTAVRAMRHEQVLERFAAQATVVPLRFATIYLRRDRIEQMLAAREMELRAILERLRGREEWGVTLYRDPARLRESIAALSPRLRELSAQAEAASPGQAYLLRKKIDALRASEARAETRRVASAIERTLAAGSDGVARLRVMKDEAGARGEVAAKFAFLVARPRFAEFRAAAEQFARAHAASGFQLELTGPWPAYNFAVQAQTGPSDLG